MKPPRRRVDIAADDAAFVDEQLGYDARLAARIAVEGDVGVALADLAAILAEVKALLLLQLVVLGQGTARRFGQDYLLRRLGRGVHLPAEQARYSTRFSVVVSPEPEPPEQMSTMMASTTPRWRL